MSRSIPTIAFAVAALSIVACAPPKAGSATSDSEVVESEPAEQGIDGRYYDDTEKDREQDDLYSLKLRRDGKYEARCAGCAAEIGDWSVVDGPKLRLAPTKGGESVRSFDLRKAASGDLRLTDESGRTQTLVRLATDECLVNLDDCGDRQQCSSESELDGVVGKCVASPEPVPCGKNTCTGGMVCCSKSDGICARPGAVCPN